MLFFQQFAGVITLVVLVSEARLFQLLIMAIGKDILPTLSGR